MNARARDNRYNKKGFTLVEVAIVLVILGLLVGLGTSMISPLTNMGKLRESRDTINISCETINSWAAGNNRIPPLLPIGPDTAQFNQIIQKPIDSWSNPLIYIYDNNLAPTGAAAATKDTLCGRSTTLITLNDIATGATINNVAYAIISPGDTTIIDTTINGAAARSGARIAATPIVTNTTLDIVRWVTLDELRNKIGCQGAQLKIVNNDLPAGSVTAPYSARIVADGGVQFAALDRYRWCVQTTIAGIAPAGLTFQKPNAAGTPIAIPNVANLFQINCAGYATANWPLARQLILSGTPTPSASHFFTIFLMDNNANATSKPFVLTVNP